tara:strand:- start:1202 stop:1366 length:165 start_codon:yes stop_codon:yes gene_type:complete
MSKDSLEEYKKHMVYESAKRLSEIVKEKTFFRLDDIADEDVRACIMSILHQVRV